MPKKVPSIKNIGIGAWAGSVPPAPLVRHVLKAITTYPYFLRMNGFPQGSQCAEHLIGLVEALESLLGKASSEDVSFTIVRTEGERAGDKSGLTRYSRTALALALHTDSTYLDDPHDLVAFQCEVAADDGGETSMLVIDDVLPELSSTMIRTLKETRFDFGRGPRSVLWDAPNESGVKIRYYRRQLEHTAERFGFALGGPELLALDQFDQVLSRSQNRFRFKLSPGEAVVMNNKRVLHARTAFNPESQRQFFRIRRHLNLDGRMFPEARSNRVLGWMQTALGLIGARGRQGPVQHNAEEVLASARGCVDAGDMISAKRHYEAVLRDDSGNYEALQALAALTYKAFRSSESERYLRLLCEQHPFGAAARRGNDCQTIIVGARGLKNTRLRYTLREECYSLSLPEGHFSLEHFVSPHAWQVQDMNVYDTSVAIAEAFPVGRRLLVNTIACADRLSDSLVALGCYLEKSPHIPVINHPVAVLKTTRAENYRILDGAGGVVFPRVEAVEYGGRADQLERIRECIAERFEFPLILRPRFTRSGLAPALVSSIQAVNSYFARNVLEKFFYIIQWKDLANREGLYNMMRVFCIDGRFFPVANLMHSHWNITYGASQSVMEQSLQIQNQERIFFQDFENYVGEKGMQGLRAIQEKVELDFFGVDFALLDDGRPYVFNCSPAMRHDYDRVESFPYTLAALDAVSQAFEAMVFDRLGR